MTDTHIDAEQAVIGGLILKPNLIPKVKGIMEINHLYDTRNILIYKAILNLQGAGMPTDVISIKNNLMRNQEFEQCGGADYLMTIVEKVPPMADIGYYATLVKQAYARRKLAEAGITDLDRAKEAIVHAEGVLKEEPSLEKLLHATMEEVELSQYMPEITTGLSSLTSIIGGYKRKRMHIIAAYTSNGKSTLAMQGILDNLRAGKRVHYHAYDIFATDVMKRLMVIGSNEFTTDDTGYLWKTPEEERARKIEGLYDVGRKLISEFGKNLRIGEFTTLNKIEQGLAEGCDLLIIDYVQAGFHRLTGQSMDRAGSQAWQGMLSRLKEMANRYNVAVVLLSQFKRGFQNSKNPDAYYRPTQEDMKESGYLEQEAGVVILMDWPWYRMKWKHLPKEDPCNRVLVEHIDIAVTKNNSGGTHQWYPTTWKPARQVITDMDTMTLNMLNQRIQEIKDL